jgi:hypothetical protein
VKGNSKDNGDAGTASSARNQDHFCVYMVDTSVKLGNPETFNKFVKKEKLND